MAGHSSDRFADNGEYEHFVVAVDAASMDSTKNAAIPCQYAAVGTDLSAQCL
jgi:hypothetical protein